MSSLTATLTQHPVGQGGMMSGLLEIPGGRFHWVYDCGSNQMDSLNREIAAVAARGDVDCLFVSHLDSDHVNGIDRLLATSRVKEVVLPYLNDLDRLIAVAHNATQGGLTGEFLTFLGDIPGWFGERGVERMTFIRPKSDDDGPDGSGPDIPRRGGEGIEGEITAKWSTPPQDPTVRQGKGITYPQGLMVQHLSSNSMLELGTALGMLDWILVPYAHRPSDARFEAFRRAMYKKFGSRYQSTKVLIRLLRDHEKLEELREAYELIWADPNLVSMALYAGPLSSDDWRGICISNPSNDRHLRYENVIGWLETGDAHLDIQLRQKAFLRHYLPLLDQVNVFGLPHHGSHRNFHPALLDAMPNLIQCVAAAGPNGYGHPHERVIDAVQSTGRQFVHVTDAGRTVLKWKHTR
jgi:hypothetical protein